MWLLWTVIDVSGRPAADQAAVTRMARGDRDALAEVYDRHGRLVYSLALRILKDQSDAEDIVQDVFAQAWRQAARYQPGRGAVVAWLMNMTRSRAIDRLRRRTTQPQSPYDPETAGEIPDTAQPIDEQVAWAGRAAVVRGALDELPLLQRMAIELAFYEGLTHVEIADRLEVPLGTVKTRIRQGLLKLKDRLAGAT
jgi:RNA polymerase sigma-70 factor (ECF subfamily)